LELTKKNRGDDVSSEISLVKHEINKKKNMKILEHQTRNAITKSRACYNRLLGVLNASVGVAEKN
jgi:hypothetical protein